MATRIRFQDALAYRVQFTARLLRRHFVELAAAHGLELTPEQWVILNKLSWLDEQSPSDLAEEALADRPNVTRIIDGLERGGLVKRRPAPLDGRKVLVSLTAQGRDVHDRFEALVAPERRRLTRGVSQAELDVAMRVLATVSRNLDDAHADGAES